MFWLLLVLSGFYFWLLKSFKHIPSLPCNYFCYLNFKSLSSLSKVNMPYFSLPPSEFCLSVLTHLAVTWSSVLNPDLAYSSGRGRGEHYQASALIISLRWVWVFQSAALPRCAALCSTFATWSYVTRRYLCLKPSTNRFRCANLLRLSSKAHKSWCLAPPDLTHHTANSTQASALVIICAEPGVLVWANPKLEKLRSLGS